MNLEPIEKPKGMLLKMAYRMVRGKFGKVLTPLKVIYARKPALMFLAQKIDGIMANKLTFDAAFRLLVQSHTSMLNGCPFCNDFRRAQTVMAKIGLEKFHALEKYQTSELFDERERAALSYATSVVKSETTPEHFVQLRKHFSEEQIVELTWLVAVEVYYAKLMIPFGIDSDGLAALKQGTPALKQGNAA
jgi:alkylhydroperoxidase family enzyme